MSVNIPRSYKRVLRPAGSADQRSHDCGNHAACPAFGETANQNTEKHDSSFTDPKICWTLTWQRRPARREVSAFACVAGVSSVPLYLECSSAEPAPDSVLHYTPDGTPDPSTDEECPPSTPPDWHTNTQSVMNANKLCALKWKHVFTHQSSSTTRTSTKNVFLLTRFLKVSGLWQNRVYVQRS